MQPEHEPARPRVLFVDDEPAVTHGLRTALRREPWEIHTAASGEEALERVEAEPFDVVVSDERMPGLQGSELLTRIRRDHPETIRIVLSGQADLDAAVRSINAAEIYRFLLKPCPPEEVALTVHEALEKRDERRRFDAWRAARGERDRAELEEGFERALERAWMGYQPVVRADDERLFGFEALLRSDDPDMRHPGALFAAAEELGRSVELGARTRALVAEALGAAPGAPGRHGVTGFPEDALVLVNVNPEHLTDPDLLAGSEPLAAHAERVVLEITERSSLAERADLKQRIAQLRDLGYRIAVDDLGAGFSGLNSFTLLAPDVVKLDMELVRNIDRSPTKQKLVASLAQLCRELDVTTIAECVETEAERDTVVALGCDLLQGFLFGGAQRSFPASGFDAAPRVG